MLRRWLGDRGERRAERFLKTQGLRTLARNWQCRHGEVDLVMLDRDQLVFVEVRVRSGIAFGDAADSVDQGKQARLIRTASMFLAAHPEHGDRACRFDVVAMSGERAPVEWIADAFQARG